MKWWEYPTYLIIVLICLPPLILWQISGSIISMKNKALFYTLFVAGALFVIWILPYVMLSNMELPPRNDLQAYGAYPLAELAE